MAQEENYLNYITFENQITSTFMQLLYKGGYKFFGKKRNKLGCIIRKGKRTNFRDFVYRTWRFLKGIKPFFVYEMFIPFLYSSFNANFLHAKIIIASMVGLSMSQ